jgi:hypothetical protein
MLIIALDNPREDLSLATKQLNQVSIKKKIVIYTTRGLVKLGHLVSADLEIGFFFRNNGWQVLEPFEVDSGNFESYIEIFEHFLKANSITADLK